MRASFIIGFIALSAAILTFAAFAPAQQQATQVRRVLPSTQTNATPTCMFMNGTNAPNSTFATMMFANFNCTQIETDNDGLATPTSVTYKTFYVNSSMSYMYSNMSMNSMGMSNTSAGMINTTTMMYYQVQMTGMFSNLASPAANMNTTTNMTISIYNVSMQTLMNCSMTATATMMNTTSQYQCMDYMNSSATYSMVNGTMNMSSPTTMFLMSSVTNNTNMSMFYINYNQSNSSMFTAMANTSVMTFTNYTVNFTAMNSTMNMTMTTMSQVNQTLMQNQTFTFQVLNTTNMSAGTNMTVTNSTLLTCVSMPANMMAAMMSANQTMNSSMMSMNTSMYTSMQMMMYGIPNPFPTVYMGEMMTSTSNMTLMSNGMMGLSINAAMYNPMNPSMCMMGMPMMVNSSMGMFNSSMTPQGMKQAAKATSYCALFKMRLMYAQGNQSALMCNSMSTTFKCKRANNLVIIQNSWVNHWCMNTCAATTTKVAMLLQARVSACAKGPMRSQKVCNAAYVKYNMAFRNQKDICAPF